MASTANFVLMALFLLLAISEQALYVKPESSFHGQGDRYVLNNKTSFKKTTSPPETTPSHASYDPTEPKPPPINDTEGLELKSPKASQLPPKISPDPRITGPDIVTPSPSIAPDIPNTYNEWYTRGVKASNEPDPDFEAPPSPKVSSVPAATRP